MALLCWRFVRNHGLILCIRGEEKPFLLRRPWKWCYTLIPTRMGQEKAVANTANIPRDSRAQVLEPWPLVSIKVYQTLGCSEARERC